MVNMDQVDRHMSATRRRFFTTAASGLGAVALASVLREESDAAETSRTPSGPLASKLPDFAPQAKACIFLFMGGGPSQMDLFDPKPTLMKMHGQPLPPSMIDKERFAFIKKDTAFVMGSPRRFRQHGESGMELSDLIPNIARHADDIALIRSMHSNAFNHAPAELMMMCGVPVVGQPTFGAWLTYGLGSESANLPAYVVLQHGTPTAAGTQNWSNGFLQASYQGVVFRRLGEPVLFLNNPPGVSRQMQRRSLDTLSRLNRIRRLETLDSEIDDRIANYELAFRMQTAAPDLIDLSQESSRCLTAYGVNRTNEREKAFSTNCLLSRRLVERGVRFVNIFSDAGAVGWDHHIKINEGLVKNCRIVDQPVAALLTDLKQRGLLDTTLVVWASEFGRTPLAENNDKEETNTGRDHHPRAFSLWMAGAGVKGGVTFGKTDEFGWDITRDPVHVNDFHATLLHLFGLEHTRLTHRFKGRDFRLTDVAGRVVKEILNT